MNVRDKDKELHPVSYSGNAAIRVLGPYDIDRTRCAVYLRFFSVFIFIFCIPNPEMLYLLKVY